MSFITLLTSQSSIISPSPLYPSSQLYSPTEAALARDFLDDRVLNDSVRIEFRAITLKFPSHVTLEDIIYSSRRSALAEVNFN